jgi:hypothetical protein
MAGAERALATEDMRARFVKDRAMESTTPPDPFAAERSPWRLAILFAAEVVAVMAFNTPNERFTRFAYCDSGSDLTIPFLIAQGMRPTVDFGYIYGLLPLLIDRLWQSVFGVTPAACRGAALVCNLAFACGLARFAASARVGITGIALIVVSLPDMLLNSTLVLVHVLEPALLVNALAYQVLGRRGAALALATTCVFVKPSMGYVYGSVLLVAITLDDRDRRYRVLAPAVITGLILAALLALVYGVRPLLTTLLPGGGLEVYRLSGHGFFRGAGRAFWIIPGGGLRDYLRYEVGSWIAGTLLLVSCGLFALLRLARRHGTRNDEIVLTCAFVHATFVLLFFGNRWSWTYYYAVLILGVAALVSRGKGYAAAVAVLAVLVLVGGKVKLEMTARLWRTDRASAETLELWASPQEQAEWRKALELVRGRHPVVLLAGVEGAALLRPDVFESPVGSYFVPGHAVPAEIKRKAELVAGAEMIVTARPQGDPGRGGYDSWPEIHKALDGCEVVWEGDLFLVERRIRPPSPGQ